jgi:hypothetical protein
MLVQGGIRVACNAYSSHFIYSQRHGGMPSKHKGLFPGMQGGSVVGMQGDGFASEPSGIMKVAVWLCLPLLLGLWVYHPTMLCWF